MLQIYYTTTQLIDLVKQNLLSIETAAQCAKMTVDEFQIVMKKTK